MWQHFKDVPGGVIARDIDGETWMGDPGYVVRHPRGGLAKGYWGPFTEVLNPTAEDLADAA